MPKPTKSPIPSIHPREKMTRKACAAITRYVILKQEYVTTADTIHYTLEAERMPRERLYTYLAERGHIWRPDLDSWKKKEK